MTMVSLCKRRMIFAIAWIRIVRVATFRVLNASHQNVLTNAGIVYVKNPSCFIMKFT
jgi:hypothetical protein